MTYFYIIYNHKIIFVTYNWYGCHYIIITSIIIITIIIIKYVVTILIGNYAVGVLLLITI